MRQSTLLKVLLFFLTIYFYKIDDDEASTVMDSTVMQYRNAIGHMVARQPFVETVSQLLKVLFIL